jgi:hypothetical protein
MKHTHTRGALANDNTDFSQYQGRTSDFQAVFRGIVLIPDEKLRQISISRNAFFKAAQIESFNPTRRGGCKRPSTASSLSRVKLEFN